MEVMEVMDVMESTLSIHVGFAGLITRTKKQVKGFDSSVLYSLCLTGYFVSQPITGLHLGSSVLYSLCLTGYFVTQSAPSQNGTEIQTKATGQIEFQIWQKTPIISCVSPKRSATLYC
jgi:hypothetical protein